jgi:hypothetical protein
LEEEKSAEKEEIPFESAEKEEIPCQTAKVAYAALFGSGSHTTFCAFLE